MGSLQLSIVNSDSYWVDAYFEETALSRIHEGDAATIKLMGYTPLLRGRVQGLSRGINVPNATPDASGLASVNPIFTFVRLAQRVPVRIHIDEVPDDIKLVAGMTATVQIEPFKAPPISDSKPASGKVGQADVQPASFQTLTDAPPQTAPPGAAKQAATSPAAPAQPASSPATQAAQPQQRCRNRSTPAFGHRANCRCPSRPRRRPTAAADAAAADLKTLQQQIAANPALRSRLRQERRRNAVKRISRADLRPFRRSKRTPSPRPRSPDTIRRRARSRWRHLPPRSPSPLALHRLDVWLRLANTPTWRGPPVHCATTARRLTPPL